MSNRNGLGYTAVVDTIATKPKIVFVKTTPTTANQSVSSKKVIPLVPKGKVNRFVPICHFCNRNGHIRPKCYKYNFFFPR